MLPMGDLPLSEQKQRRSGLEGVDGEVGMEWEKSDGEGIVVWL